MSTTPTTAALSIDFLHDLESSSSLKTQLNAQQSAIFGLAGQVLQFANAPVKTAAAAKTSAQLSLSAPASWTLPNGIVFSLSASASCTLSIDNASETFSANTRLDSSETTNITAGPVAGIVYINIDFNIQGSASASGNFNGLGIAGTVSGGRSATVSFCQPVDDSLITFDAIKRAFSQIVFPLDPASLTTMQTGALSHVVFDGTFNAELDVTFGLGDHTFAAPSVAAALASAQSVGSITPPSIAINAGATGAITYTHTDHFGLVVDKSTATVANIYLIRMLASDAGLTAGFIANITTTNVSIAIDQSALRGVVKQVTKSDALATAVVNAASIPLNNLVTGLNAKLASRAAEVTGQIGLAASLDRQKNRTALFVFDADLTSPELTQKSFTALISGNIKDALDAGGLKLQPGSGVFESLQRSAAIHFQFFNLFAFDSVTTFFSRATAELGPDGTIRLHASIGDEARNSTNKSFATFRIFFVTAASSGATGAVGNTEVDLRIELSEANRAGTGGTFTDTLTLAPAGSATDAAKKALGAFLGGHPNGKVTLVYDIKLTAYSRLLFTPYNGRNPGALPQANDQANWLAFYTATCSLSPNLSFASPLNYSIWTAFNQASINQPGSSVVPDRRQTGNPASGISALGNSSAPQLAAYFLAASQGFMNLCEDLRTLADAATAASDLTHYNKLLAFITSITTDDLFIDYAVPTAGALLRQCTAVQGAQITTAVDLPTDNSAITCTLTLS